MEYSVNKKYVGKLVSVTGPDLESPVIGFLQEDWCRGGLYVLVGGKMTSKIGKRYYIKEGMVSVIGNRYHIEEGDKISCLEMGDLRAAKNLSPQFTGLAEHP
jgi:hypothetical protein